MRLRIIHGYNVDRTREARGQHFELDCGQKDDKKRRHRKRLVTPKNPIFENESQDTARNYPHRVDHRDCDLHYILTTIVHYCFPPLHLLGKLSQML